MANINEENQLFENYLVERTLPMMLQDPAVRPALIENAIFFIGETNIPTAYNCFIENKKYNPYTGECDPPTPPPMAHIDTTPSMAPMIIDELVNSASSSALTDSEHTPNGGKRRKRTRKRRKRRKSRQ